LKIYHFPGVNRNSIIELINYQVNYIEEEANENIFMARNDFCSLFPLIDRASENKLITTDEHNLYVGNLLVILGIEKSIVPWLFR
jgi:hypothetical protein